MLLVVDANIVVSILIAKGSKHKLFFSKEVGLISPDMLLFEVGEHWKELSTKSKLTQASLKSEFTAARMQIHFKPLSEYEEYIEDASKISPDPEDAEYFALALKHRCPIWSHDKKLKQQTTVEVINTEELLKKLGLI